MGRILLVLVVSVLVVGQAEARTWHVNQDGTGDFTVIQDAVDAASSGDVIAIGPGRYDEFTTLESSGTLFDVHVLVPDGYGLTFIGAGIGETIIGPEDPESHDDYTYGFFAFDAVDLVVRGIFFENCNHRGIYIPSGTLHVDQCRFYYPDNTHGNVSGIRGGFTGGAVIENCEFESLRYGVATSSPSGPVAFESCSFLNCETGVYAWTPSSNQVTITDSSFDGGVVGVSFLDGAGGAIDRCQFSNCTISLGGSGDISIVGCTAERDDGVRPLRLNNIGTATITDNIFQSNGDVVECFSYGPATIRNNHFIRTGGGYWIECGYAPTHQSDVDFSMNYWGTTDLEEIAEGIWDCNDDDHAYNCVIFEPIADGPVSVETHSWSSVKALFGASEDD